MHMGVCVQHTREEGLLGCESWVLLEESTICLSSMQKASQ